MTEFSVPTDRDYDELARKWVSAENLIREEYGYELDQSEEDLTHLQKVIDDELIDFQNAYALECLGVVLGRALAHNVPGLDWWIVEDDYRRDPIMRYGQTSLQWNVMYLLGKRLSRGESVDVRAMYSRIIEKTEELKDKVK